MTGDNNQAQKNTVSMTGLVSEDGNNGIIVYQTPLVAVQFVVPIAQLGRLEQVIENIRQKAAGMVVVPGSGPQPAGDKS